MPSLKPRFQSMLRRIGLYERVKTSRLYDIYWSFVDRKWIDQRNTEVNFYRELLDEFHKEDLIIDIGANNGEKTDIFLRLGARVVAVEPDMMSQRILQRKFLKLRFFPKRLSIVGKAVSEKSGTLTMWIDGPGSAMNTVSGKWAQTLRTTKKLVAQSAYGLDFEECKEVATTTLDDLIHAFGEPSFIKIDVEGHELNVLRGMRRPVPCLSFEVNLPEFRTEGLECVAVLNHLACTGQFNYSTGCQHGMALSNWVGAREFLEVLTLCNERSIDVFWKCARM